MSRLFITFLSFIFIFSVCKCEEYKGTTIEIEANPITDESTSGFSSSTTAGEQESEDEEPPVKETGRQFVRQPEITIVPASADRPKLNVLEVLKGMGSAIQMLISQHKQQGDSRADEPQTNESKEKYREQAENLRTEINRRSGQLQKVVGAAIEALKDRGDVVVRRILENLQTRLGQAKQRADKILGEPESGELAVRTLHSINQGMNNLNSLVQHVLSRVNISINVDLKDSQKQQPPITPAVKPEITEQ